ncbi:hypothetical protein Taro_019982 [Colocasia esculenta]|uniref:GAT domain-containing protein n=1 Tax=Colocasia esculenta TaxID=4460 RepID=A0A843UXQ2_COLES|nr:hypothetical protein [Colocasia esculenta]
MQITTPVFTELVIVGLATLTILSADDDGCHQSVVQRWPIQERPSVVDRRAAPPPLFAQVVHPSFYSAPNPVGAYVPMAELSCWLAWTEEDFVAVICYWHSQGGKRKTNNKPSLKSRNVSFNVERDSHPSEGISSVETVMYEPLSFPEGYPLSSFHSESREAYDVGYAGVGLSIEEKKEILVVTRNTLEVLSSILNSNAPNEAIRDDLTLGMLEKCKDSQQVIQRITETAGDDEETLFEALNLHEQLEQVFSKYAEMEAASPPPNGGPSLEHHGSANSSWEGDTAVNEAGNIEDTVPAANSRKAGDVQNADKNEPSSN